LEEIIVNIVYDFENLDIDEIIRDINEDRTVSGFPEVNDYELVENHLIEKKRSCVKLILKRLNNLDTKHLIDIMTRIVDEETANGEIQASSMIEDLVDDYKLHTQNFLEQEFEKIKKLIEVIRDRADDGTDTISPLVDKLLQMTQNWDNVAQPIQLSMKSRGLDEQLSSQVANTIRLLSIDLTNDYGYVDYYFITIRVLYLDKDNYYNKLGYSHVVFDIAYNLDNFGRECYCKNIVEIVANVDDLTLDKIADIEKQILKNV
jgi:hypothetical protein